MQGFLNISLNKIKSNWIALNAASQGKAAAVIKANAYGLGMNKIAKALVEVGCNYFYVANIDEAIELRKENTSNKISIAIFEGFFEGSELIYFNNNLIPIINNLNQLKRLNDFNVLNKKNQTIKAILNIDTGMNRLGLNSEEINFILRNKSILYNTKWEFIMSHLANSNDIANKNNYKQLKKIITFSKAMPNVKLSLANTFGIKLGSKFCLDQTRPGIGLYGIDGDGNNINLMSQNLKIPFELFAPIIQIKNVNVGEQISYGGIDTTNKNSKLATIGIGYADGWLRLLKKNSSFLIEGQECKVIGNITMDSFILDITNIKKIKLKEESYVSLIDNSNLKHILRNLEIISYEFLTLIGNRIVRRYN